MLLSFHTYYGILDLVFFFPPSAARIDIQFRKYYMPDLGKVKMRRRACPKAAPRLEGKLLVYVVPGCSPPPLVTARNLICKRSLGVTLF